MSNLDAPPFRHAPYVSLAVACSAVLLSVFGRASGDASAFVSALPVAVVSAFFGSRAGLVPTIATHPDRLSARLMYVNVDYARDNDLSSFVFSLTKAT